MPGRTREASGGRIVEMTLPDDLLALLRAKSTCYIATLMKDGSPQLTQVWVDTDGEHVIVNSVDTHLKVRNLRRDPRVAVTISDPAHPGGFYQVRGRAISITEEGGAGAHRDDGAEVHRRLVSLVRRPRSGARGHHDRGREGQQHRDAELGSPSRRAQKRAPRVTRRARHPSTRRVGTIPAVVHAARASGPGEREQEVEAERREGHRRHVGRGDPAQLGDLGPRRHCAGLGGDAERLGDDAVTRLVGRIRLERAERLEGVRLRRRARSPRAARARGPRRRSRRPRACRPAA